LIIDFDKLDDDYKKDGIYSLQLEVGDKCNQGCIYCYMNAIKDEKNVLSDEKIKEILFDSKKIGISAIEWLGGEPLLRDSIFQHIKLAKKLGFRNNIWTGGLPLSSDNVKENIIKYTRPGLLSVHVSTLNPRLYQKLHPNRSTKDLDIIIQSIKKIIDMGYPSENMLNSVTFTGLQKADDMIDTINYFKDKFGIACSLNVYHTYLRPNIPQSDLKHFIPSSKEIEKVYNHLSKQNAGKKLPMNCVNKQYCSATIAILSNGNVTPCATIRRTKTFNVNDESFFDIVNKNRDYLIFKKMKDKKNLNEECRTCELNSECWGCRSRSYASGNGIYGMDPRCFRN